MSSDPSQTPASEMDTTDTRTAELERKLQESEAKLQRLAQFEAQEAAANQKKLNTISTLQPEMLGFIEDIVSKSSEQHAEEMEPVKEWAKNVHLSSNPANTLPLTRLISCASTTMKRSREEKINSDERDAALHAAEKKLDEIEADNAKKDKELADLGKHVQDLTSQKEFLYGKLASCGMVSGLESNAPLQAMVSVASAGASKNEDAPSSAIAAEPDLMQFITSRASASSNCSIIRQSGTGHSQLGGSDPLSAEINAFL